MSPRIEKAQNSSRCEDKTRGPPSHSFSSPGRGQRAHPAIPSQDPHLGLQERTSAAGLKEFRRAWGESCVHLIMPFKAPGKTAKQAWSPPDLPCSQLISQKPHPDWTGPHRASTRAWMSARQGAETDLILYLHVPCLRTSKGLTPHLLRPPPQFNKQVMGMNLQSNHFGR